MSSQVDADAAECTLLMSSQVDADAAGPETTLWKVLSKTAHKDQRPFSVFSEAQVKQGQTFEKRPY